VIKHPRGGLAILLGVYITLALLYCFADPLYESTDEIRHFRYVRHLVVYRSLPVQSPTAPRAQSHHPPLYYTLGALVSGWVPVSRDVYFSPPENPFWGYNYWEVGNDNKTQYIHGEDEQFPFRGATLAAYLVRIMTILIGAGAVVFTFEAGREALPKHPELALAGAAVLAFNPQFLYLSGAINNDVPAALFGAALLWACIRVAQGIESWRSDLLLGALFGAALLTKLNLAALLAPIQAAYILAARRRRDWRIYVRGTLIVLGSASVIAGWWFVRNWQLYGDPTGMSEVNQLWAGRSAGQSWWALKQGLPYLWSSLWGRFGYGQAPLPDWVYRSVLTLSIMGLGGYLIPRKNQPARPILLVLGTTILATVAVVLYYMLVQPAGAMGRFLFPGLPAFSLLLVIGVGRFFSNHLQWAASLIVVAIIVALGLGALVGVLIPAFAQPHLLTHSDLEKLQANPADVDFGTVARLVAYDVEPTALKPGATVRVTLYWQALSRTQSNYAVFVHLLSDVGTMVAQRDTYPGLGRYPTTSWKVGSVFRDIYRVTIPDTAYAPDTGVVEVGLYLPEGERLRTPNGADSVQLARVKIDPHSGNVPNAVDVNFSNQARLIGYRLDQRNVHPGDTVQLVIYWQAASTMDTDYTVFVHVAGSENQVWARDEGWPVQGRAPTSTWTPGQVVEDIRRLTIGMTTPDGVYDIEVGLYDPDVKRLPIVASDGHWLSNRIHLTRIKVTHAN